MNDQHKIQLLKKVELFASLTADELRKISGQIVIKTFKKNKVVLHEENTNEFMYVILEGEAKVVQTTGEGRKIILSVHRTGDFFGELSLIDSRTVPATIITTKDSVTAIISKKNFYSLLLTQSKMLENLLHILSSRLRESWKKIQLLNFNNASQRIKMLLLMLSEDYGKKTGEGTTLHIKLIHQDIADMTGLTRETVTRVLDKWKRGGEIRILSNKLLLLCPEFESISF